jgi:hypothetical protein
MTKEEWESKQNSQKKSYKYVPTGNPGEVKMVENIDGENPEDPDMQKIKGEWNKYLHWLDNKKMKGISDLDKSGLGNKLFQQYIKETPGTILSPKIIPIVRKAYNEYRKTAMDEIMAGRAGFEGKSGKDADYDRFMPHIVLNEKSADPNYVGQHLTQTYFPEGLNEEGKVVAPLLKPSEFKGGYNPDKIVQGRMIKP